MPVDLDVVLQHLDQGFTYTAGRDYLKGIRALKDGGKIPCSGQVILYYKPV